MCLVISNLVLVNIVIGIFIIFIYCKVIFNCVLDRSWIRINIMLNVLMFCENFKIIYD